jgi:hypothetical protein
MTVGLGDEDLTRRADGLSINVGEANLENQAQ